MLNRDNQTAFVYWHLNNKGHKGPDPFPCKGHALKVLGEVIELCVACGASSKEILQVVTSELCKEIEKRNDGELKDIDEEIVDVLGTITILHYHVNGSSLIKINQKAEEKIKILNSLEWEVDDNGVLHHKGRGLKN